MCERTDFGGEWTTCCSQSGSQQVSKWSKEISISPHGRSCDNFKKNNFSRDIRESEMTDSNQNKQYIVYTHTRLCSTNS